MRDFIKDIIQQIKNNPHLFSDTGLIDVDYDKTSDSMIVKRTDGTTKHSISDLIHASKIPIGVDPKLWNAK